MPSQFQHRRLWIAFAFVLLAMPAEATGPINPYDLLATAQSYSASGMELAGARDPSTVARLYLTVPETSEVIINGNRTRATGRDRYFEIPIDYDVPGQVKPTTVKVLELTHHGAGQPEASGYQNFELSLISGTTTYFTVKPQKKKQEEAMDLRTLTAFMPAGSNPVAGSTPPSTSETTQTCCPEVYPATIKLRFIDDGNESLRKPSFVDWGSGNPKMLFKHGIAFDTSKDAHKMKVSLSFNLHGTSGDRNNKTEINLGPERTFANLEASIHGDVIEVDVSTILRTAILESLLLRHNAATIIAKDWVLSFNVSGREHSIKYEKLRYEVKVLANQD